MSNYTIKITKLTHYVGENESQIFLKKQIVKHENELNYNDISNAIDDYRLQCKENAKSICTCLSFFQDFTIQLIDNSQNKIMYHFHCNNL
jgi:hypothetical protein